MRRSENVTPLIPVIGKFHFFIFFIFTGFYSHAQLSKVPLAQRVYYSDLIIEGRVTGNRSFWNRDHTMIYTASTVEIFKIFKGMVSTSSIEILTEGGVVDDVMIKVEPALTLEIGDMGIFTCEHVRRFKLGRQRSSVPQYEAYAHVQGFIRYDLVTQTAGDVFNTYRDIENELYRKLLPNNSGSYLTLRNFDIHENRPSPVLLGGLSQATMSAGAGQYMPLNNFSPYASAAAITGFLPTIVAAGTGGTISITGSGFGATQGSGVVRFSKAGDGGATFVMPHSSQYVYWGDTQIIVEIPAQAGTGPIQVTQGATATSATPLTIIYSHQNVDFDPGPGTVAYQVDFINDNTLGGYSFRMNTGFDANAPAKASLLRALDSWRCNSGVNWIIAATTTISDAVSDGTNIITFDGAAPLAAGVLGVGYSYWSGCASGPTIVWYVNEMDLILDDGSNISPFTWEYGPSAPSGSEYDFESLCLQQLGRLHQLGYVNDPTSVMHYDLPVGVSKRTPSAYDIFGASVVYDKSIVANVCGPAAMTAYTCNSSPTDIALSNASVSENAAINTVTGTLSSTDPDAANTFTYTLVTGTGDDDNASFNINGDELRVSVSPDLETKSSYTVRIRTTDQDGSSYEEAFAITITNVNETPTDLSLSANTVNENVAINTVVGTFSTTDPDAANTFTYTLVTGTGDDDNASFNINGDELRVSFSPALKPKAATQ